MSYTEKIVQPGETVRFHSRVHWIIYVRGIVINVIGVLVAIALRQLAQFQGRYLKTAGFSVWLGTSSIVAGIVLVLAGLMRYRRTRTQLDEGKFEPAGFVVDLVTIVTVLFGLALAGYLVYTEKSLG